MHKCIAVSKQCHKKLFLVWGFSSLYMWSLECCERCDVWRSRLHMTSEARYKSHRDKKHTDTFRASDILTMQWTLLFSSCFCLHTVLLSAQGISRGELTCLHSLSYVQSLHKLWTTFFSMTVALIKRIPKCLTTLELNHFVLWYKLFLLYYLWQLILKVFIFDFIKINAFLL